MKFTVVLEPEADGGYSVSRPAIPGWVSQGESLDEALANIREAIVGCLEVDRKHDLPPPLAETPELIAQEILECLLARAEDGLPLTIETPRGANRRVGAHRDAPWGGARLLRHKLPTNSATSTGCSSQKNSFASAAWRLDLLTSWCQRPEVQSPYDILRLHG